MSNPQPSHDAPKCPVCGGHTLAPQAYQDGCLRPLEMSKTQGLSWFSLQCAACGELVVPIDIRQVLQAWFSVGAYEQTRVES